jgi:hypothetical protein
VFCLQVRQVSAQVHDIRGRVGQLAFLYYTIAIVLTCTLHAVLLCVQVRQVSAQVHDMRGRARCVFCA